MIKKCFVFAVCALTLAACKKKPSDVTDEAACDNTTFYYSDSVTVALATEVRTYSTNVVKIEDGVKTIVANASGYEFWGPVISPDKQHFICFRSTVAGNTVSVNDYEHAELWMFNMDGSNGHMVLSKSGHGWTAMGMADWAPDNKHIILAAEQLEPLDSNNPHWSLFMTDTTGATITKMNTRMSHFTHPRFANGNINLITYSALPASMMSGSDYRCEIFYANVNASFQITSETMVTNDLMFDYAPSFSPDNSKLVFCKTTSMAANTAVTLNTYDISSGSSSIAVSDNTINDSPYWCPTNNFIYYIDKASYCFKDIRRADEVGGNKMDYFRTSSSNYYSINIK
jgi:Tol biopolymer transport system component